MYKVVFEYADGRKGACIVGGKVNLFDTKQEAENFASDLNDLIEEDRKPFFPVYRVEKAEYDEDSTMKEYKEIYGIYSRSGDMTFIIEDTYDADGELLSTECVGFYYGEETDEDNRRFYGKLKAEF